MLSLLRCSLHHCVPLVVCVLLIGCTGTRDPKISVTGARLGEVTDEALTLHIGLRLENTEPEPLKLLEFAYEVEVAGAPGYVYKGVRSAEMTLAQGSTREIEIPAVVNLREAGWLAASAGSAADADVGPGPAAALPEAVELQLRGDLRYLLPGAIAQTLYDMGLQRPSAPLRGSSVVSLREAE